jgi:hypothetical protein
LISTNTLRLALFAALGIVLELFVVEEYLLAGRKNELGAAVDALEYSIGEFHGQASPEQGRPPKSAKWGMTCRSRFPVIVRAKTRARAACKGAASTMPAR